MLQRSESSTEPTQAENEKTPALPDTEDIVLQTDVSTWLSLKGPTKDGVDVRGGHPEALIVLATKATKGILFSFYFSYNRIIFMSSYSLKVGII